MRNVSSLKGMHSLRTRNKTKKRSVPGVETSVYLDLYMLNKEKERLLKEDEKLCMRKVYIKKRIGEIDMEMNKLQRTDVDDKLALAFMAGGGGGVGDFSGIKKGWKKMYLGY